ncbi:hypothetical protein FOZ63_006026 [Perkinsus olseni]|uniref:Uncharacterized protein n=1 Tax=Perkinsus olseni TaxID=32597 RepID=A0A7J6RQR0_PEROL|nr:hypothetical protein FOZ63_006026 [Perkinsus olseni]
MRNKRKNTGTEESRRKRQRGDGKPRFLEEPEVYVKDGMRFVKPYRFEFRCYVKRRWLGRTLLDICQAEFMAQPPEYYENAIKEGKITIDLSKTCYGLSFYSHTVTAFSEQHVQNVNSICADSVQLFFNDLVEIADTSSFCRVTQPVGSTVSPADNSKGDDPFEAALNDFCVAFTAYFEDE